MQSRFLNKKDIQIIPIYIASSFLDLVEKTLLKHWNRENIFRIFSMPQLQKCAEWNGHFCAAHKGDFFTSKQVYFTAHEV